MHDLYILINHKCFSVYSIERFNHISKSKIIMKLQKSILKFNYCNCMYYKFKL